MEFIKSFFKFIFGLLVVCFLIGLYIGVEYGKAGDYYALQEQFKNLNLTKSQISTINQKVFSGIETNTVYVHLYKDSK